MPPTKYLMHEWNEIKMLYMGTSLVVWASLVAQTVKRLSTMWETWVWSLGWEDSLEKEMATHTSTLALKIPWKEELGAGYYPWGCKESGTTEQLHFHFPWWSSDWEFTLQYKRCRFNFWSQNKDPTFRGAAKPHVLQLLKFTCHN